MLMEGANTPLSGGLVVVPTLVESKSYLFPVQVVDFSQEDVWLNPRSRLGIQTQIECIDSDPCEVQFERISADTEVTFDRKEGQTSDSDFQLILDNLHIGGTQEEQAAISDQLLRRVCFPG